MLASASRRFKSPLMRLACRVTWNFTNRLQPSVSHNSAVINIDWSIELEFVLLYNPRRCSRIWFGWINSCQQIHAITHVFICIYDCFKDVFTITRLALCRVLLWSVIDRFYLYPSGLLHCHCPGQSYDCSSAPKATMKCMVKYVTFSH